jgi:hypothetical protein
VKQFIQARRKAGLDWVTIHDLRHFRATQWIMRGVDLRTVQELLGHITITTTMRYAHFAPNHAARQIIETQQLEARELTGEKQAKSSIEVDRDLKPVSLNPAASMPETGVEPDAPCGAPDLRCAFVRFPILFSGLRCWSHRIYFGSFAQNIARI